MANTRRASARGRESGKPVERATPAVIARRSPRKGGRLMTDTEVVKLERLGLTPREAEVLAWVAQGKSNGVIGAILGISPRTVQKHLERTFSKLGVESRTAAAAHALTFVWADSRAVAMR